MRGCGDSRGVQGAVRQKGYRRGTVGMEAEASVCVYMCMCTYVSTPPTTTCMFPENWSRSSSARGAFYHGAMPPGLGTAFGTNWKGTGSAGLCVFEFQMSSFAVTKGSMGFRTRSHCPHSSFTLRAKKTGKYHRTVKDGVSGPEVETWIGRASEGAKRNLW